MFSSPWKARPGAQSGPSILALLGAVSAAVLTTDHARANPQARAGERLVETKAVSANSNAAGGHAVDAPPSVVFREARALLVPGSSSVPGGVDAVPRTADPCADGGGCSPHATCSVDESKGQAVCLCDEGWIGDGVDCSDVDECLGDGVCSPHATCLNTAGSFTCTCDSGFLGDGQDCVDVDECAEKDDPCDPHATCQNLVGGYVCSCDPGWAGDGTTCADVDECTSDDACGDHAACVNQAGNFYCTCNGGFRPTALGCVDIDECAEGTHDCGAHARCINFVGSFECLCDVGYEGDGTICTNVDECAKAEACGPHATCVDEPGSHHCDCDAGYSWNGGTCVPETTNGEGGGTGGTGGSAATGGSGSWELGAVEGPTAYGAAPRRRVVIGDGAGSGGSTHEGTGGGEEGGSPPEVARPSTASPSDLPSEAAGLGASGALCSAAAPGRGGQRTALGMIGAIAFAAVARRRRP